MCVNMVRGLLFNSLRNNSQYKHIIFKRNNGSYVAEQLQGKGLIRISGETSSDFLQGLITNDMRYFDQQKPSLYCMFLNNKGRVLFDSIIYKTKEKHTFYLECDNQVINQLMKHLSLYKVRRKIDIANITYEYSVWAMYNPQNIDKNVFSNEENNLIEDTTFDQSIIPNGNEVIVADPRIPALGYRTILKNDEKLTGIPSGDLYDICRYKLGVGEGVEELLIGQSFPLEMNCDYLNGVSFDKGCYIGQELTARTFHTGVTRKRMMPLIFEEGPDLIPCNTPIDDPDVIRKSPIGKVRAFKGKYGIGLMRISEALGAKSLKTLHFTVKTFSPSWWNDSSLLKSISG